MPENEGYSRECYAPGARCGERILELDCMSRKELNAYYRHFNNIVIMRDNIEAERTEERAKAQTTIARNLKSLGMSNEQIAAATGLTEEEINKL